MIFKENILSDATADLNMTIFHALEIFLRCDDEGFIYRGEVTPATIRISLQSIPSSDIITGILITR